MILSVCNGFYNLEKSPAYNQKVNKAIDALREETNWETPHLPKIEGEAWKDVSHKDNGALIVKKVYFNDPVTVVLWADGTKTIVRCQEGDVYSKETGLALCVAKKALGNKGNFNDVFHEWIPEEEKKPEVLPAEVLCVTPEAVEENVDE